jgi:hypothetical protein
VTHLSLTSNRARHERRSCAAPHFIETVIKRLPMEYAVEMNRLIELKLKARSATKPRPATASR